MLCGNLFSQELPNKQELNKISNEYVEALRLSEDQTAKFIDLLENYNNQLTQIKIDDSNYNQKFNSLMKQLDLAVHRLLDDKGFDTYKKVKKIVEPYKKYRL